MMKYPVLLLFMIGFLLCFTACEQNFKESKQHKLENTHEYPKTSTRENKKNEEGLAKMGLADNGNRWIWQKPELVIEQLGELDNKTVVDIGAGPYGYFSFRIAAQTTAKKVIAADIDQEVVQLMEGAKKLLPESTRDRFEARLVKPDNPMLAKGEADVALIVNTSIYLGDRLAYFKNLRKGIAPNGKIVIIDFKKKNTPIGPSVNERIPLGQIEQDLRDAGYSQISSDDRTLDYQYIVTAINE